jgi:hypothetical protein
MISYNIIGPMFFEEISYELYVELILTPLARKLSSKKNVGQSIFPVRI